jgi:hypothetical protein
MGRTHHRSGKDVKSLYGSLQLIVAREIKPLEVWLKIIAADAMVYAGSPVLQFVDAPKEHFEIRLSTFLNSMPSSRQSRQKSLQPSVVTAAVI